MRYVFALAALILCAALASAQCPCADGGPCICKDGQCRCLTTPANRLILTVVPAPALQPVYGIAYDYRPMPSYVLVRSMPRLGQPLPPVVPSSFVPMPLLRR